MRWVLASALCFSAWSQATASYAQAVNDDDDEQAQIIAAAAAEVAASRPDPLAGVNVRQEANRRADLVIIVSIDGLREDISHHAPTLERLRREGSSSTDAWTIERSATLPSHSSMLSGVDVPTHGINFNGYRAEFGPIRFPTIFRVARAAGLPSVMFIGKNKFRHLEEPNGVDRFVLAGRECKNIVRRATADLQSMDRGIIFLHFADPDAAGHTRGWMSGMYRRAVQQADQCVESVRQVLETRSTRQRERTLMIVTADHGGHGRSHGSPSAIDRHIPWIAWGAGVARGAALSGRVNTTDTAATALEALGLPQTPGIEGRPVRSIWSAPSGSTTTARPSRRGARR